MAKIKNNRVNNMDNYINKFHTETDKILDDYIDNVITYPHAQQRLHNAGKQLMDHFQNHLPHTVVKGLFDAFSELQVQAYKQNDITMETAILSIESMAGGLLNEVKNSTQITQAITPYKQQIGAPATFVDISSDPLCGVPHLN